MTDRSLEMRSRSENGVMVVEAVGDIGTHEATAFQGELKQAVESRPRRIVVDLAGVRYMTTAGLAILVDVLKTGKTELVICGLQDRVKSVFEISRLTTVFRIVPTQAEALA